MKAMEDSEKAALNMANKTSPEDDKKSIHEIFKDVQQPMEDITRAQ